MINLEHAKMNFKDHIATYFDYGNIKILDFKRPGSSEFSLRFLFEEDYCRLHISGDLGELTAVNFDNMTYEGFRDYINCPGYFREKVRCHARPLYEYDKDLAREQLREYLNPESCSEELIDEIMDDYDEENGIGAKGYEILDDADPDCFEYASILGRRSSGIAELYLMAFSLAYQQLSAPRGN